MSKSKRDAEAAKVSLPGAMGVLRVESGGGRFDSAGEVPSVLLPLLRTIHHFFGDLPHWLRAVHDRRDPTRITYPIAFELWTTLLLYWSKLTARRQIRFQFNTSPCLKVLNHLAGCRMERMMAPDTLPYGLLRIPLEDLEKLQHALVYRLIRNKALVKSRLLGQYYTIAIDMTGYHSFEEPHCDGCLRQEIEGKTVYLHEVLEAKLVTPGGMALSIASEFVENHGDAESRQDCELKAFYRLAPRLKKLFPQLPICLLLDGLYAVKPVLDICEKHKWKYIITFKEGRAPAAFGEYERLWALGGESAFLEDGKQSREFRWLNGLPYGGHKVNVLECRETHRRGGARRCVWMSCLRIDLKNYEKIADGGRQRWRIENEGFNIQKNGGFGLEHAYSENEELMKRFYILLQIAHTIYQLLENGLLRKEIPTVLGSIRNVARRLLEEIRLQELDIERFNILLGQRIQIRLDTS